MTDIPNEPWAIPITMNVQRTAMDPDDPFGFLSVTDGPILERRDGGTRISLTRVDVVSTGLDSRRSASIAIPDFMWTVYDALPYMFDVRRRSYSLITED